MKPWLCAFLAVGCSSPPTSRDVVGPFTGEVHRFVVDAIHLPVNNNDARTFGDDLDHDGTVDNQAGTAIAALTGVGDGNAHGSDMIASGVLASSVEIQADDLDTDGTVAVTYFGAAGDAATLVGGKLVAGAFEPNRTFETHVPGEAILRLPVFADADPIPVHVVGLEIFLAPDGNGGFDARLAGGVLQADVLAPIITGIQQMVLAHPHEHLDLARMIDTVQDGTLTRDEVAAAPLVRALLAPDIQLFDGERFAPQPQPHGEALDSISLGIGVHLRPCASGSCIAAAPADPCHDRVRDGSETDVDCGGACEACAAGARCTLASDCETNACDASHCRAPSCSDGAWNGFESDVDCGDACGTCASSKRCNTNADCASLHCDIDSFSGSGHCR